MTRTMLIAAAAMVAITAGAADARPAKADKQGMSQHSATRQLNEQQLASINNGTPGMSSPAAAPAPGDGMASRPPPAADAPAADPNAMAPVGPADPAMPQMPPPQG